MLFSDIEGSTQLLLRLGDRYADALDLHRVILRSAWTQHGGQEMGTEGDSFFVVFGSATNAVRAALQAQRGLARQAWPDGGVVTVRMGLHSGRPMPHGDGYVGIDVHRAARVSGAAHGRQIVISDATHQEVAGELPDDARTLDLGWHRLRDFTTPIHLYQVGWARARETFPPLKTLGTTSSLPPELTSLVGRSDDLHTLQRVVGC